MAGALKEAAGGTSAAAPGAEPLVDLDFARQTQGAAGRGLALVTCVRPTPGYVEDSRGVWTLVAPDTPRLSDCGLLVEEARTNWIRNNAMAGAAEGTPGDLPTHWRVTLPEGCAGRVVETGTLDGIDYLDLGVAGEARGGSFAVAFEAPGEIPAAAAQAWACSAFFQVVSDDGEVPLSAPRLAVSALSATGKEIEAATVNLAPERFERAHVVMQETPVGTASLVPHLAAAQEWAGPVDFVVRIGWPQLELGTCPTSPIRTAGAKATRDADHIVAPIEVAAPCTIVAEFTVTFPTAMPQAERRVVWSLADRRGRTSALAAGDASPEGHPTLAMVDEKGRGIARSVRGFDAGALLRVGATLSSDVIESGCVALNGTPNSLLKGWLGEPDAALTLGRDGDGRGYLCGTLRRLTVHPRALGISELMAMTRPLRSEASLRGTRGVAQPSVRRAPEPEVPAAVAVAPAVEEGPSAREGAGPLAAARRLFAFRRRATDLDQDASEPVRAVVAGTAEAAVAPPEPEPELPRAFAPEPDPALLAARREVADLEERLAAEQARVEALETAHRAEHERFGSQIAVLEAKFRTVRADAQASGQVAEETAARIAELEAIRSELQARVEEARNRASELEGALTAERDRTAELERELEAARRSAAAAQMQAAVEQAARTRSEAEQARLARRVETLQAGMEETRALAAASARVAGEEAARAAAAETRLRQELDEARRHGSEVDAALTAERALWSERERSAEEERAEIQTRMAQLDARAEEALARASDITERLGEAEAARAALAQALTEAQAVAASAKADAEAEAALRTELAQLHDEENARLLRTIADLEARAAGAEERAAAHEARAAALATAVDQARASEADNAAADLQADDDEREALRLRAEDLERQLEEASARAAAGAERIAALDDAQTALAQRLDQARLERVELAEKVESGEAQRAELARAHAEARDALTQQITALQLRVTEALAQAAGAAADLAGLQQERAALAASLDEARRRAAQAAPEMGPEEELRPQEVAREHAADSSARADDLAQVRSRLEGLLAAAPDTAPPGRDAPVPAASVSDGPDPAATDHHSADASSTPAPGRRATGAVLAVIAAAAAIGALFVVQPHRAAAIVSAVAGKAAAPAQLALSPPYVPGDGVTFSSGFDTVRLDGLEAPPWGAVCRGADGEAWPCGLRARDALVGLIKGRAMTCLPAGSGTRPLPASCAVEGRDLGAALVEQGWARPSTATSYAAEAAEARRNRRGLWATGDWGAAADPSRRVGEVTGDAGPS